MERVPLLSVIVPVYKTERYLNQCIRSIIEQTYKNLEIILVEDGSPDHCSEICDQWGEKDSRIKVIHQANGGGGKARNCAINCAEGEYIAFVDSDDYIAPCMFEVLYSQFSNDVDIVECDYCKVEDDSKIFLNKTTDYNVKSFSTVEAMRENITGHYFQQVIWNKMYRKNVIGDIRFPEGTIIDDEFWTYKVIGRARSLIHVEKVLYAYRQQNQSIMHTSFSLNRLQAIKAQEEKLEYMAQNFPELRFAVQEKLWLLCLYLGQLSLKYLQKLECKEAIRIIQLTLEKYSFSDDELHYFNFEYKIWWYLSKHSIERVCKIRNFFKIGE